MIIDISGFCIPSKEDIFPHLNGYIRGFGKAPQDFSQWQEHHIKNGTKEYDFTVYSIVKFFDLCLNNNPNMIGSLFTPRRCILHSTSIGEIVRENRKAFLHKGAWFKFKGYAYSQMHKMKAKKINGFVSLCKALEIPTEISLLDIKTEIEKRGTIPILSKLPQTELITLKGCLSQIIHNGNVSKRIETIKKNGYDVKFAFHTVRLLNEVEQILTEGDLDLERNSEQLKAIRRGDWDESQIVQYFEDKEKSLEEVYSKSTLRYGPDEEKIKQILMQCLEHHFGNLEKAVHLEDTYKSALNKIKKICDISGV